jgi:hypothetical protein
MDRQFRVKRRRRKIPGSIEWSGYRGDLDVRYAHKLFFGKSTAEVQRYFGGTRSIERADELLFMPRLAFQYYVFAFADFVLSAAAAGDSDSASSFLRLLVAREERDVGSVATIYLELLPFIEQVSSHQSMYEADPNIYGSFPELAEHIRNLCKA